MVGLADNVFDGQTLLVAGVHYRDTSQPIKPASLRPAVCKSSTQASFHARVVLGTAALYQASLLSGRAFATRFSEIQS